MNAQLQPSTITTTQAERLDMKCIIGSAIIGGGIAGALLGAGIGHADDGWMFDRHAEIKICVEASTRGDGYAAEKAASRHDLSYSDAQILVAIAKEDCAAKGLPH